MTDERLLLVHEDNEKRIDKHMAFLKREGKTVRTLKSGRTNALDAGREEFYALSSGGVKPLVIGYGEGVTLALGIAEKCPVSGLACVDVKCARKSLEQRRLSRNVFRELFLIVAPTVIAVGHDAPTLAARIVAQVSSGFMGVIQTDDDELWSEQTLLAILERLYNTRDTKALVSRQILSL